MVTCPEPMGHTALTRVRSGGWHGSPAGGETVALRNGSSVSIGPLAAGDDAAIASWFAGLGAEARYARFFSPLEHLDRRTQVALARVDHVDHEAIAARSDDGATVGIARYIRFGHSTTAEVAVAVADDWRGLGVATMLLDRVVARARTVGIEQLAATCLATNFAVIRLFSRMGDATVGAPIAGVVDIQIDLTGGRQSVARGPAPRADDAVAAPWPESARATGSSPREGKET